MSFAIRCPACQSKLNVEERLRGRTVKCPKCQGKITIPTADDTEDVIEDLEEAEILPPATVPPRERSAHSKAAGATSSAQVRSASASTAGKGGLPWLWIVGGAITFCVLGGGVWFFLGGDAETPPANPTSIATNNSDTTTPPANDGVPAAATPVVAPPVDTANWISLPENPVGIQAKFPTEPQPFNLLENTEPGINRDFGEAVLKSMQPTALRSIVGDRSFSFTLARLELSGMPVEVYLERAMANMGQMHAGYQVVTLYRTNVESPVAMDALLRSETGTRVVRIAHDGERAVTLMVDGPLNMPYEDPQVQGFLATMRIAHQPIPPMQEDAASRPPTEPEPIIPADGSVLFDNPQLKPQKVTPLKNNWQVVKGKKFPFEVRLPDSAVSRPTLQEFFAPGQAWDGYLEAQQVNHSDSEVLYLNQGTRRFLVIVAKVATEGLEWYEIRGNAGAMNAYGQNFFHEPGTTWEQIEINQDQKMYQWTTSRLKTLPSGETVSGTRLEHSLLAGEYGFLLVFESSQPLDWNTAEEQQFFTGLVAPENHLRKD